MNNLQKISSFTTINLSDPEILVKVWKNQVTKNKNF